MPFYFEGKEIDDYTIEGINHSDCPDYCDAFISEASLVFGGPLTEQELDRLNDSDLRYEMVWEWLH